MRSSATAYLRAEGEFASHIGIESRTLVQFGDRRRGGAQLCLDEDIAVGMYPQQFPLGRFVDEFVLLGGVTDRLEQ